MDKFSFSHINFLSLKSVAERVQGSNWTSGKPYLPGRTGEYHNSVWLLGTEKCTANRTV